MARRKDSGQVAVETALVMPFTVFLILGVIQLSMIQQARLLTDYAAFRAVRAGALDQISCKKMLYAALEGVLPSFGRADSALEAQRTFDGLNVTRYGNMRMNQTFAPSINIVDVDYVVKELQGAPKSPYTAQDFDDPDHPLTLVVDVTYNYELRIPFADYMIHQMWTGVDYFGTTVDELVPATQKNANASDILTKAKLIRAFNSDPVSASVKMKDLVAARALKRYFVPIRAGYSMRMMSNLPNGVNPNAKQACPGTP